MFTQLMSIYYIVTKLESADVLKNAIRQLERNEWLLPSAFQQGLQQKIGFCLNTGRCFFVEVSF